MNFLQYRSRGYVPYRGQKIKLRDHSRKHGDMVIDAEITRVSKYLDYIDLRFEVNGEQIDREYSLSVITLKPVHDLKLGRYLSFVPEFSEPDLVQMRRARTMAEHRDKINTMIAQFAGLVESQCKTIPVPWEIEPLDLNMADWEKEIGFIRQAIDQMRKA